jgi:hypothetical protein
VSSVRKPVITTKVLQVAMGNRMFGNAILGLLLLGEQGKGQHADMYVDVTKDVLKMAVGNERYGADMISIFLERYGDRLPICGEVLETARGNKRQGHKILQLINAAATPGATASV